MEDKREERPENAPTPSWTTFSGAAGGVWAGSMLAASPFTGAEEPLALDEARHTACLVCTAPIVLPCIKY